MNRPQTIVGLSDKLVEIKSRSIGPKKYPSQSKTALTLKAKEMAKSHLENSLDCNYCGVTPSQPKEKCRAFLCKCKCRKCGKEGNVAWKCLSKPQT